MPRDPRALRALWIVAFLALLSPLCAGPDEEAEEMMQTARAAYGAGDVAWAVGLWEQAAGLFGEAGNRRRQADAWWNLGVANGDLGRYGEAIVSYEKALPVFVDLGDAAGEADCRTNLGYCYGETGEYRRAIEFLRAALQINLRLGRRLEEGLCRQNLGAQLKEAREYSEALESLEGAAAIFIALGREESCADCWRNLGTVHDELGRPELAIDFHSRALEVYRRLGVESGEAACLSNLGSAYWSLGQYQRSIELHDRALQMHVRLGRRLSEAGTAMNLGVAYCALGQFVRALEYLRRAEAIYLAMEREADLAVCSSNIGAVLAGRGDQLGAIDCYNRTLEIYTRLGLRSQQAEARTNLGNSLMVLGRNAEALEQFQTAQSIFAALGLEKEEAHSWQSLGVLGHATGAHDLGLRAYREASALYRRFARAATQGARGRPGATGWMPEQMYKVQGGIARIYRARGQEGDLFRAFRHLSRAIVITERLRAEAASSTELRTTYFATMLWVYDDMVDLLLELKRRRDAGGPGPAEAELEEQEPQFWADLGLETPDFWPDWSDYEEAALHFSDVARARALQELLANREIAFSDPGVQELHRRWTELVARERALSRRLAASQGPEEVAAQWEEQLQATGAERERCERELSATSWGRVVQARPVRLAEAYEALTPGEALVEYKLLRDRLVAMALIRPGQGATEPPRVRVYETTTAPGEQSPIWGETQSVRQDSVLGRLQALQARDQSGLGIAAPEDLAGHFTLAELVWLYRRPMVLTGESAVGAAEAEALQGQQLRVAAALFDLVLRPLEADLQGAGVHGVIVVPDGALYYLPFAGLVESLPADVDEAPAGRLYAHPDLRYAVERRRLSYLPSVAMHVGMLAAPSRSTGHDGILCVFADPLFAGNGVAGVRGTEGADRETLSRLPNSRDEALEALAGFGTGPEAVFDDPAAVRWGPSVALVARAAQESLLYSPKLRDYRYLLLSTHGIVVPDRPEFSYIALSSPAAIGIARPTAEQDGRLTLPEAFGLNLNARLVTLSACRAAEGDFKRGEGILGLTAAMFVSGARAVIASLWSVDDAGTAKLMGECHRGLGAGRAPAQAFTEAQLRMLGDAREAYEADPTADAAAAANPYVWAPFIFVGEW